jgi:hypothetical protein
MGKALKKIGYTRKKNLRLERKFSDEKLENLYKIFTNFYYGYCLKTRLSPQPLTINNQRVYD